MKLRSKTPRKLVRTTSRGAALTVEVALCLPLLLTVLFACYELARANMILHATESAAYEGARVGIIPGATSEKIKTASGSLLSSVGITKFTIHVNPSVIDETTENVDVSVLVPFRENMTLPPLFMADPTFRGNCSLSREISR